MFSSRIRDECLYINSFWSLVQARVVIGDWKHDYSRPPPALIAEPPSIGPQRCLLYPPMNDSRLDQFTGPVTMPFTFLTYGPQLRNRITLPQGSSG